MPMKPKRQGGYGGGGIESEIPLSHLWVGNLPLDVTESDLTELFGKHGMLDGITCYASRSYAFVYFKRAEDAAAAKDALQGFLINGNPIKIEFAKPAKPSKHVWVGGFGSSVSKEKLEEELSKFGTIEDLKFIRDRNTALVEFVRLEDASAAVKNMNGLQIGGDRIRVDFLRSHSARREQSDFHEMGNAQFRGSSGLDPSWINPDIMRNYPEPIYSGHKRAQPSHPFGGRKAGHQSKVLWVGYPPSVVIDEEMLHNAMILYGEIERIKCFPARHYSFVEFRSVEEARRAKEALQGRLFNDPRITIMFSSSDSASGKDFGPFSGFRGQGPDMFPNEVPFRPPLMDIFSAPRAMAPNCFPRPPTPNGVLGPAVPRPFGPKGSLDPLLPTPDFNDPSRRNLSPPAAGLLPAPAAPSRTSYKTTGWDVLDPNQLPREPKRSRIDGPGSFSDPSLPTGKGEEYIVGLDQPFGAGQQFIGGPLARVQADSGLSPADVGVAKGHGSACNDEDFIWRGVIAKGGTPVCHARCIPIGKGLECELPEVVNCSARTGLDMLAKHYAGAIGFDIVFFLPDSEDDFANYTEFLRYLGSKNRAGVAKLDDGTTLFLVPPSEFLTDVLKVAGRERLYGVVLKLPQQLSGGTSAPQQVHQPLLAPIQHIDGLLGPPTHEYVAPKKEMAVQMDYGRATPDETTLPPKAPFPTGSVLQDQSSAGILSTSLPGVTLTPELIATLASLLPAKAQSSVAQSAQPQLSSSSTGVVSLPVAANEKGAYSQGWSQPPQLLDQTVQSSQQYGSQPYPNAQLTTNFQPLLSNFQFQSPSINPLTAQSHPVMPSTQGAQLYSFEAPQHTQKGYAMVHGTATGPYGIMDIQQPKNSVSYSNQIHGVNLPHQENVLPSSTGNLNAESHNQAERLHVVPSGVGQGTAEGEVDKNQRYQSTLQFAASLLLQIQQQQQANSHMGNQH